ncbi:hypothetical protein [Bartonella sp. B1098]|uniref:hypothetical protein n=1 Tax=Bartonella sp. B1098 TaxID=2911421 RepID=UPI0020C25F0F|nr:hypothetical protein [Bartonella sp. B1098]
MDSEGIKNYSVDNKTSLFSPFTLKVEDESFIQQDKETNRLTIGAKAEGGEINIANNNSENRILSGVKEAVNNNEAVNKGQLDTNIKKIEEKLVEAVGDVTQQVKGDALLWNESDDAFVA